MTIGRKKNRSIAFSLVATVLLLIFGKWTVASAKDLGFRFQNNSCVNNAGQPGLNPTFFGQCGDLRNLTISGANFDDTDFSGAVFDGSDFQKTSFVGSKFFGSSFVGANLSGSVFTGAIVVDANLNKAILINAHLAGADISNTNFSSADLTGQVLSTMNLSKNNFANANFLSAILDNANLAECELSGAKFSGVNLQGAKLDGAVVNRTVFVSADLSGASLKNVKGASAVFSQAIMRQSNLELAMLNSANMKGAKLEQAMLKKADLRGSSLHRAVLKDANIEGVNFNGVVISKTTVLPISIEEAMKLGMSLDSRANLMIIHDDENSNIGRFLTGLTKQGIGYELQGITAEFKGDIELGDYSAILHLNFSDSDQEMPESGQDAIKRYVQEGGVFIGTGTTSTSFFRDNHFKKLADLILFQYKDDADADGRELTLTPKSADHPVLSGITSSIPYESDSISKGDFIDFSANPSLALMTDQDGIVRVAARRVGQGHAVGFNLGFVDEGSPCLSNLSLQKLVANSTKWANGRRKINLKKN